MNIFHGPPWESVLQILRDPIFALVFSLILAILGSRAVRKVIKTLLYLGALAMFIWLVTHNKSFADLCLAIIHAALDILLVLIGVLAAVSIIAIICVFLMFVISKPSPYRLPRQSSPWRSPSWLEENEEAYSSKEKAEALAALTRRQVNTKHALILLDEKVRHLITLMHDLISIAEHLADNFDDDSSLQIYINILHIYFSGLSSYMVQIKKIHKACNAEIKDLASMLPVIFSSAYVQTHVQIDVQTDIQILENMARARIFLPDNDEWQDLREELDIPIHYIFLRLFCLRRDWKEACTLLYKSYRSILFLANYQEALIGLS